MLWVLHHYMLVNTLDKTILGRSACMKWNTRKWITLGWDQCFCISRRLEEVWFQRLETLNWYKGNIRQITKNGWWMCISCLVTIRRIDYLCAHSFYKGIVLMVPRIKFPDIWKPKSMNGNFLQMKADVSISTIYNDM